MDFFPAIWNVLHDGSIIAVRGTVPGTIQLDVSIDYLRERFPDAGKTIQVTLTGCTRFAYRDFDESDFTTDFSAITVFEPEVLSGELRDGLCVLDCAGGVLEVRAASGSLVLDSGRAITLQELIDVSDAYWTELSERARKARQT
jgi:hypothetical protein